MSETKHVINCDVRKLVLFLKTAVHFGWCAHFWVLSVLGVLMYVNITEEQLREPMIKMAKTYMLAYGTLWNASFQTIFLCLALVHDMLQWLDKHESKIGQKIKYFRDVIFNGLVFPFTCFVTGMFWTVYFIDRELVFPQVYDQIVPWWLNHCVHTNIFIVIAIETILTSRRYPTDVKVERFLWVFVSVLYAVVYYSIFFFGGCWLYGVFGVMTWWQVCIYQACIWLSTWIFYRTAFIINRVIHKEDEATEKTPQVANGENIKETRFDAPKNGFKNGATLENGQGTSKIENSESNRVKEENQPAKQDKIKDVPDDGDVEDGKKWKSIEASGVETDATGLEQPFEKSWSTKYRINRTQFEKSSL